MAGFFGLVAVGLAVLGVRASAGSGHTLERLSLRAWLAQPQAEGAAFVTDAPVKIEAMTEAIFMPRLPPRLIDHPAGGRYLLAAFAAEGEHRLLLAAEAQVASLPHLPLAGVTVSSRDIGVPAAALDELKQTFPDLDTRFVTGLLWTWKGP